MYSLFLLHFISNFEVILPVEYTWSLAGGGVANNISFLREINRSTEFLLSLIFLPSVRNHPIGRIRLLYKWKRVKPYRVTVLLIRFGSNISFFEHFEQLAEDSHDRWHFLHVEGKPWLQTRSEYSCWNSHIYNRFVSLSVLFKSSMVCISNQSTNWGKSNPTVLLSVLSNTGDLIIISYVINFDLSSEGRIKGL